MTPVQAETLPVIIRGTDVLAKAKTGTGKTLAFLIPSIEVVVNAMRNSSSSSGGGGGGSNKKISVLILSPTRELASQIGKECEVLLRFQPSLKCAVVFGGVPIKKDHGRIAGVDFLVATPGRLIDHLDNTAGFMQRLAQIDVLIFDEADQMLDMGFKPAIDKILSFLPPPAARQTLLFSATVPKELKAICKTQLRPGYAFCDTVGE